MTTEALPDDQQEDVDDLGSTPKRFSAVVTSTDWTVETILEQLRKGNIELNPSFQRREAWRKRRKSQFIESLILGVPVPQIVLAERKNKRGSFIVIDGKQRLLTLRQFCALADDKEYENFSLTQLDIRKDLVGIDYAMMSSEDRFDSDFAAFENSTVRTAVIRNWPDENFLYTVFLRLNTGSVPLSPQELRQALHPGGFSRYVDDYSISSTLLRSALNLSAPDFRMRDAELVIRYFAFRNSLGSYKGNLKPLLDDTTEHYNRYWAKEQKTIELQTKEFEDALQTTIDIFGASDALRKWNGASFERQINRAVFDIMIMYFIHREVAKAAKLRSYDVVEAFKKLCVFDETFRSSIEGTTKSIEAIYERLHKWGETLRTILGKDFPIAQLKDNRIHFG